MPYTSNVQHLLLCCTVTTPDAINTKVNVIGKVACFAK